METSKRLGNPSILRRLGALELELQPVSDKRNEFRIGGLPLGIAHRIPKEPLQGVQIPPIPGYLDGVADGALHPAGGRPEGFRYLGIQHLRDGVDHVHIVYRDDDGLPQILVALDVGGDADLVQDLGHRQLVAVHTGGQMVLFLPHSHFDHAAGEDILTMDSMLVLSGRRFSAAF